MIINIYLPASFFLCTGLTLAATAGVSREAVDAHSAGTPGLTLFFMGPWQSIFCIFLFFVLLVFVHHVCSRRCRPLDMALLITLRNRLVYDYSSYNI